MGFALDKVVPWGRSYEEYVNMFGLTIADLKLRILGCGDGPASFNFSLTKRGGNVISVDPIYIFDATQIKSHISETYEIVITQMYKNQNDYIWDTVPSVEELGRVRRLAMDMFLSDYDAGKSDGRYIAGELPFLPFKSEDFDIALSSHFLFLYSDHLSAEFHLQALQEMLRVASEVRVFPIVTLNGTPSPHLAFIMESLRSLGFCGKVQRVPYEFQRGANKMLVIKPV